jgi:hypothetical protein
VQARRFTFTPKSTASLRPGDFWSVPLPGGRFGCGRVVALKRRGETGCRVMLIAGLLDWIDTTPPSMEAIRGRRSVAQGEIHLRAIWETGGNILGSRSLEEDGIVPDHFLSESPGRNCFLMSGYDLLRPATEEEQRSLPVFSTWGYLGIRHRAEVLARRSA